MEFLIRIACRFYARWSRVFNKIERKLYIEIHLQKHDQRTYPTVAWSAYLENKHIKWKKDKWWMGWGSKVYGPSNTINLLFIS